ncbi:MAG: hypothetical protein KDC68_08715 [Gelidibacter sp.]|nr:hypothetical protein [Gelidibacter sp.]
MIKQLCLLTFLSLAFLKGFSQDASTETEVSQTEKLPINDGPYIFINQGHLIEKNIANAKVTTKKLNATAYDTLYRQEGSTFSKVSKMAVFSDIHGQYQLAVDLLKNNHTRFTISLRQFT